MSSPQHLRSIFGQPELTRLIERLRRRIEGGHGLEGLVVLNTPSQEERRAVDRLLGRPPSKGRHLHIQLDVLEDQLRHSGLGGGLREAVEAVTGPLTDRRAARQHLEERWNQLLGDAERRTRRSAVLEWLRQARTRTLLRRYSRRDPERGRQLLTNALEVIERLPAQGKVLAELAAETTGDSHALDAGRPLGTLVIAAAARLAGEDDWHGAENRSQVWAAVGVAKDDVSASVVSFALPTVGAGLCDQLLQASQLASEPCRLTTGQLYRHPPTFSQELTTAYVVENPAVLAAARRLGSGCRPLICTDGQPTVAVHALLTRLADHGVTLLYHGDFDWPGIRIFSRMWRRYAVTPWRFTTADYQAAPTGVRLTGKPAATPWDPPLHDALLRRGRAVHEEQVIDLLLADLAST